MAVSVKEIICENEFPEIVSVTLLDGEGQVIDDVDYVIERTCTVSGGYDDLLEESFWHTSCGHMVIGYRPRWCPECGAKVVEK